MLAIDPNMELHLSLGDSPARPPPPTVGDASLGLRFGNREEQLRSSDLPPLELGLSWPDVDTRTCSRSPSRLQRTSLSAVFDDGYLAGGVDINRAAEEDSGGSSRGGGEGDGDEDESPRKKLRLSKEQAAFLEESFKEHNTLNPKQKVALAKQLGLRARQVEVWFQNRRARTKLKQTEVDCEYLKRCCETLTVENRQLQKEVADLRALKAAQPFYMHLPATTLSMCPSCERVSTASSAAKNRFFPFAAHAATPPHQPSAAS